MSTSLTELRSNSFALYLHFLISYSLFNSFQSGFLPHSCTKIVLGDTSDLYLLKSIGLFWLLYIQIPIDFYVSNYSILLEALSSLGFWVTQYPDCSSPSLDTLHQALCWTFLFSAPLHDGVSQDSVPSSQTSSLYSILSCLIKPLVLNVN